MLQPMVDHQAPGSRVLRLCFLNFLLERIVVGCSVCSGPDGVDSGVGVSRLIESCRLAECKSKIEARLSWCAVAQSLKNPMVVVTITEFRESFTQFTHIAK